LQSADKKGSTSLLGICNPQPWAFHISKLYLHFRLRRIANPPERLAGLSSTSAKKSVRYNMAGQQVNASYKGLVIENGKKFVQK